MTRERRAPDLASVLGGKRIHVPDLYAANTIPTLVPTENLTNRQLPRFAFLPVFGNKGHMLNHYHLELIEESNRSYNYIVTTSPLTHL